MTSGLLHLVGVVMPAAWRTQRFGAKRVASYSAAIRHAQ